MHLIYMYHNNCDKILCGKGIPGRDGRDGRGGDAHGSVGGGL